MVKALVFGAGIVGSNPAFPELRNLPGSVFLLLRFLYFNQFPIEGKTLEIDMNIKIKHPKTEYYIVLSI